MDEDADGPLIEQDRALLVPGEEGSSDIHCSEGNRKSGCQMGFGLNLYEFCSFPKSNYLRGKALDEHLKKSCTN